MIWQKIGDVVDAVGQGRKQLYEGKEYDYVFDVDFQDGVPPLKLPYNVTGEQQDGILVNIVLIQPDNPYAAAQKFLESNDLPLSYIDEVVKFIEKNTSGVNIGTGGEDFVDPYTGNLQGKAAFILVDAGSRSIKVSQLGEFCSHCADVVLYGPLYGRISLLRCFPSSGANGTSI